MKLQMNRGTGLLLFALVGCLPTSLGFAEPPHHLVNKPLERAGRLFGVCWGDGYHACASSGKRLLADLPPQSNLARPISHHKSGLSGHRHGPTFYDRFDALNQSLFHTSECCVPGCEIVDCDGHCGRKGCDNIACDSPGCDGSCDGAGPGYATERGVMMAPGSRPMSSQGRDRSAPVDLPSFSGPPQPEIAAPSQNDASEEESERLPEPKRAPSVKPSKPADKASTAPGDVLLDPQPILTAPLAGTDLTRQIPIPRQTVETAPDSPLTNEFRDLADPLARRSQTPSTIVPEFPTKTESPMLGSAALEMPTFARTIERPARLGQMTEPVEPMTEPVDVVAEPFGPVNERPTVTAPTTIAAKPRRLGQSETGPTTANLNAADENTESQDLVSQRSDAPGARTAVVRPSRPTRLGASSAAPPANPFDARPVVEMAKRASESDEGVVRQPSQLK